MFIVLLFAFVQGQIHDCSITTGECSDNYNPVCGLNITESPLQTFPNECYACKASQVVKYKNGECVKPALDTPNQSIDIGTTNSTLTKNFTTLIQCSDPRPSICETNTQKLTCGFFDQSVSCSGKSCLQQFNNDCFACSNTSIHSYFYGNCSDYIPEQPTVIQCNLDSASQCNIKEKVDVCGFLDGSAICQNPPCLQPFDNSCEACQQSNITSYFVGKCNQYNSIFEVASQQTDYFVSDYQYCSASRPSQCNSDFKQVCGVLKQCQGNGCERNYDNTCQACSNYEIEGYYYGECLHNQAYILTIVILFIINLI